MFQILLKTAQEPKRTDINWLIKNTRCPKKVHGFVQVLFNFEAIYVNKLHTFAE